MQDATLRHYLWLTVPGLQLGWVHAEHWDAVLVVARLVDLEVEVDVHAGFQVPLQLRLQMALAACQSGQTLRGLDQCRIDRGDAYGEGDADAVAAPRWLHAAVGDAGAHADDAGDCGEPECRVEDARVLAAGHYHLEEQWAVLFVPGSLCLVCSSLVAEAMALLPSRRP